jgi:hypothetical protein
MRNSQNLEVMRKDAAATRWCENATSLTSVEWRYLRVPQKDFEAPELSRFGDLAALAPLTLV